MYAYIRRYRLVYKSLLDARFAHLDQCRKGVDPAIVGASPVILMVLWHHPESIHHRIFQEINIFKKKIFKKMWCLKSYLSFVKG